MVINPASENGAIASPTIEISQEGLRCILNEIETKLLDSEVYRRTMAGLQTMLGEGSDTAQILVKAVGREAVRLTFQQLVRQYNVVPVSSEGTSTAQQENLDSPKMPQETLINAELQPNPASVEDVINAAEAPKSPSLIGKFLGDTKSTKISKAELAAQKAVQEREEILRQVGQELRQAREARSLSTIQLYSQTLVPLHHIEALEAGRVDELPEDVYVRGFIRRIAYALGLNGLVMADSIPEPDPVKSVIPSWYHATAPSVPGFPGFQLSSVHLYLGYTALIAGAVGGLSWMSNPSNRQATVEPEAPTPSQSSVSPKAKRTQLTKKPGIQSSKTGVKAGSDIAPPEALAF